MTLWTASLLGLTLNIGPTPGQGPASSPPPTEGQLTIRLAQHYAKTSRRDRRLTGSLTAAFGSAQIGLGVFGVASRDFSPVMRRSGVAQLLLGTAGISMGVLGLARRSAMERLTVSPEFAALHAAPNDPETLRRVDEVWRARARTARLWRRIVGGGYIAGGVGLIAVGTALLFPRLQTQSDVENQWAYATLGTGVSLALGGSLTLATRSGVERAYAARGAIRSPAWIRSQPRLQFSPTVGGAALAGWF